MNDEKTREELEKEQSTFEYKAKCRDCDWSTVWETAETWRKGAPREHANWAGHTVDTEMHSTKVLLPSRIPTLDSNKEPTAKDAAFAFCEQCKVFIGVGAGRFFNAAWKAHYKATKHDITVTLNPKHNADRSEEFLGKMQLDRAYSGEELRETWQCGARTAQEYREKLLEQKKLRLVKGKFEIALDFT